MKYPILYAQNATDFFSLGLGPLKNTLSAKVIEERNGSFYLEAEILVDSPIFPLVLNDCLIKADAGHLLKDQRFRIKRIVPKHNGTAEIYAEHVSYLAEELTLKPEVTVNGNAGSALTAWKGAIVESNPFVVDSDISTTNSTKWRIDKVTNPRQALGGVEGSILDVWGGEYRFDNYRISLLQKRGTTANTVLAYGRNITDFEQENNIADTYTSIVPYAIYTDDNENEITVTVDGYTVHSQYAGNYPNTRSLPVNFSDEFDHNEVPTKAKLTQLAEQYITANEVGVPKTSIKVSFLDLSKSPDYAEYQHLEELNLCDDVRVYYPKLGVNTIAKVIRTVWNVLTESYDEIEIGEKRMTLSSKINEQTKQIKEINTQTNYAITSADGKNTIFVGLYGEDGLGEPTATKIGDSWLKPDGEFTEWYVWDGTVWKFLMSNKENHEIQEKIEELETQTAEMIEDIDTAVTKANQAVIDAGFAKDQADTAHTLATYANQSAQDAVSQSSQAHQLAVQSATDASTAFSNAQTAMTNAQNALNKSIKTNAITYAVSTSQTTVPTSGWQATVPTASSTQYVWTRTSVTLQDDSVIYIYNVGGRGAQGVKGDTGAGGANAPKITAVKPQFYLSTSNTSQAGGNWSDTIPTWVEGRHYWVRYVTTYDNGTTSTSTPTLDTGLNTALVTSLQAKSATETLSTTVSQHATQIEARALKSTVDTLTGRVDTAEGSITANATAITQRATKTEVNTLSGRVSTAEGQISTQAGQIAQRLTASEVNSLVDGKGYATQASVNSQVSRIDGDINSWSSQLQSVDAKVDGIEIGGRNLLRNSDEEKTASREYLAYANLAPIFDEHGTGTYTFSFDLKSAVAGEINVYYSDRAIADIKYKWSPSSKSINATTEYKRYHFIVDVSTLTETATICNLAFYGTYDTGRIPSVKNVKIEKGNKATDWTPAPEDLATVTALTTNVNQINQSITDTNNSIQLLTQTVTQNGEDISSISADLTVADGKITGLTTKTDGHTTQIGNLQTGYDGLQSTVATVQSDLDGKVSTTAFSSLEQLVSGIQTTVADKEDKTVVSQLASQWQTTTDLANGHTSQISSLGDMINLRVTKDEFNMRNLVPNGGGNPQTTDGWNGVKPVLSTHAFYKNGRENVFTITTSSTSEVYSGTPRFFVKPSTQYSLTFWGFASSNVSSSDVWLLSRPNGSSSDYTLATMLMGGFRLSHLRLEKRTLTFTTPSDVGAEAYLRFDHNGSTNGQNALMGFTDITLVEGSTPADAYIPDVITQINLSPSAALIAANKVQITGNTYIANGVIKRAMIGDAQISGAKIADATISSGKIISLDAGKITAGMINTSNITIGTATSGKRVNITGAGLIAHDSNGRLRVKLGVQDLAGDGQSDPSTLVFYTGNGTRSASIGTNTDDTFVIGTEQSGVYTLIRTPTQLTLESSSVRVNSPAVANNNYWNFTDLNIGGTQHPNLRANIAGTGTIGTANSYRLRKIYTVELDSQYLSVGVGDTSVAADFNTGADTNGGRVWSMATYNRTYSGSANMYITNAGTFGRVTSARKYKMDIQVADDAINNAKKILQINPVSWIDKSAFLNGKSKHRYHGFIADDFHDLGLNEVVVYGSDGQVEGLGYDRISMYHNVILRDHEQQLSTVTQQLNSLSNGRLQETLLLESKLLSLENTVLQLKQEIEQLRAA